jgi:hypothetical protein
MFLWDFTSIPVAMVLYPCFKLDFNICPLLRKPKILRVFGKADIIFGQHISYVVEKTHLYMKLGRMNCGDMVTDLML